MGVAPAQSVAEELAARGSVTNLPLPRFVSMRAESANARRGPSLSHRVDWEFLHRGMPLEVISEYGHWRRVRDADGAGGWVHHSLISGQRTVLLQSEQQAPLRAAPEENARIRAMIEPGAIARLTACSGAWCRISADKADGWVNRELLWGVSSTETID